MERHYTLLRILFAGLSLLSLAGFLQTYIVHLANYATIPLGVHFHFVIFLCWIGLLIYQPYLIQTKRTPQHKRLGKLSYGIAPLMVLSISFVVLPIIHHRFPAEAAVRQVTGAVLDAVSFSVFFILSMRNSKRMNRHVAYLLAASLIVFNPGIGRLLSQNFHFEVAIFAMVVLPFCIPLGIMLYEKIKLKRAICTSPYLLVIGIWTAEVVLFGWLPQQVFWVAGLSKWGA